MPIPVDHPTMSRPLAREAAYETLRDWIVNGTLEPNETIRDHDVAAALGVSRTPVREALRRLEDEGFVQTSTNRWTRVAPVDVQEVVRICPIIGALEELALSLAADCILAEHLLRMTTENERLRQAILAADFVTAAEADTAFHEALVEPANNPDLERILDGLRTKMLRFEIAYFAAGMRGPQSVEEHEQIIAALRVGAIPQAQVLTRENWSVSQERLQAALARRQA
jgi:DNA-binding GntR family transcriptional regulator